MDEDWEMYQYADIQDTAGLVSSWAVNVLVKKDPRGCDFFYAAYSDLQEVRNREAQS